MLVSRHLVIKSMAREHSYSTFNKVELVKRSLTLAFDHAFAPLMGRLAVKAAWLGHLKANAGWSHEMGSSDWCYSLL